MTRSDCAWQEGSGDTTAAGTNILRRAVTSPVSGDVFYTRIDTSSSDTMTEMSALNPMFAQLAAGTAEIGKLAAGTAEIGNIGTVTTVTTCSTVTNLAKMGGVAISLNTGVRDAGTQRITICTDDAVPVTNA